MFVRDFLLATTAIAALFATILGVLFAGTYLFGEVGLYLGILAACSILAGLCYAMDKRSKRKAQP